MESKSGATVKSLIHSLAVSIAADQARNCSLQHEPRVHLLSQHVDIYTKKTVRDLEDLAWRNILCLREKGELKSWARKDHTDLLSRPEEGLADEAEHQERTGVKLAKHLADMCQQGQQKEAEELSQKVEKVNSQECAFLENSGRWQDGGISGEDTEKHSPILHRRIAHLDAVLQLLVELAEDPCPPPPATWTSVIGGESQRLGMQGFAALAHTVEAGQVAPPPRLDALEPSIRQDGNPTLPLGEVSRWLSITGCILDQSQHGRHGRAQSYLRHPPGAGALGQVASVADLIPPPLRGLVSRWLRLEDPSAEGTKAEKYLGGPKNHFGPGSDGDPLLVTPIAELSKELGQQGYLDLLGGAELTQDLNGLTERPTNGPVAEAKEEVDQAESLAVEENWKGRGSEAEAAKQGGPEPLGGSKPWRHLEPLGQEDAFPTGEVLIPLEPIDREVSIRFASDGESLKPLELLQDEQEETRLGRDSEFSSKLQFLKAAEDLKKRGCLQRTWEDKIGSLWYSYGLPLGMEPEVKSMIGKCVAGDDWGSLGRRRSIDSAEVFDSKIRRYYEEKGLLQQPMVVEEEVLLREAFDALNGISGDFLRTDSQEKLGADSHGQHEIRLKSSSALGLRSLLHAFEEAGRLRKNIEKFLEFLSGEPGEEVTPGSGKEQKGPTMSSGSGVRWDQRGNAQQQRTEFSKEEEEEEEREGKTENEDDSNDEENSNDGEKSEWWVDTDDEEEERVTTDDRCQPVHGERGGSLEKRRGLVSDAFVGAVAMLLREHSAMLAGIMATIGQSTRSGDKSSAEMQRAEERTRGGAQRGAREAMGVAAQAHFFYDHENGHVAAPRTARKFMETQSKCSAMGVVAPRVSDQEQTGADSMKERKNGGTLIALSHGTHELTEKMHALATVCWCGPNDSLPGVNGANEDSQEERQRHWNGFPKGVKLLSYLYSLLLDAGPDKEGLLRFLFTKSCRPLFHFLRSWLLQERLPDPYGEFLRQPGTEPAPAGTSAMPGYSEQPERELHLPSFLEGVAAPLQRAGQQMLVLRQLPSTRHMAQGLASMAGPLLENPLTSFSMARGTAEGIWEEDGTRLAVESPEAPCGTPLRFQLASVHRIQEGRKRRRHVILQEVQKRLDDLQHGFPEADRGVASGDRDRAPEEGTLQDQNSYRVVHEQPSSVESASKERCFDEEQQFTEGFTEQHPITLRPGVRFGAEREVQVEENDSLGEAAFHFEGGAPSTALDSREGDQPGPSSSMNLESVFLKVAEGLRPEAELRPRPSFEDGDAEASHSGRSNGSDESFRSSSAASVSSQTMEPVTVRHFHALSPKLAAALAKVGLTGLEGWSEERKARLRKEHTLKGPMPAGGERWICTLLEIGARQRPAPGMLPPLSPSDAPLSIVVDVCVVQEVLLWCEWVSVLHGRVVEEVHGLHHHLGAIRRYLFMECGEWAAEFSAGVFALLHGQPARSTTKGRLPGGSHHQQQRLQQLLHGTLSIFPSSRDDPDAEHLYITLAAPATSPEPGLTGNPRSATAYIGGLLAYRVESLKNLHLGYRVQGPLSRVLTAPTLAQLSSIFSTLLRFKYAVWALEEIRRHLQELERLGRIRLHLDRRSGSEGADLSPSGEDSRAPARGNVGRGSHRLGQRLTGDQQQREVHRGGGPRQPVGGGDVDSSQGQLLRKAHLLRHRMLQVVGTVLGWVQSSLLQVPPVQERRQLQPMRGVEDLLEDFVQECLMHCLQSDKVKSVRLYVDSILQCVLDLHLLVQGAASSCVSDGLPAINSGKLESVRSRFEILIQQLAIGTERAKDLPHLNAVLNMNGYFRSLARVR